MPGRKSKEQLRKEEEERAKMSKHMGAWMKKGGVDVVKESLQGAPKWAQKIAPGYGKGDPVTGHSPLKQEAKTRETRGQRGRRLGQVTDLTHESESDEKSPKKKHKKKPPKAHSALSSKMSRRDAKNAKKRELGLSDTANDARRRISFHEDQVDRVLTRHEDELVAERKDIGRLRDRQQEATAEEVPALQAEADALLQRSAELKRQHKGRIAELEEDLALAETEYSFLQAKQGSSVASLHNPEELEEWRAHIAGTRKALTSEKREYEEEARRLHEPEPLEEKAAEFEGGAPIERNTAMLKRYVKFPINVSIEKKRAIRKALLANYDKIGAKEQGDIAVYLQEYPADVAGIFRKEGIILKLDSRGYWPVQRKNISIRDDYPAEFQKYRDEAAKPFGPRAPKWYHEAPSYINNQFESWKQSNEEIRRSHIVQKLTLDDWIEIAAQEGLSKEQVMHEWEDYKKDHAETEVGTPEPLGLAKRMYIHSKGYDYAIKKQGKGRKKASPKKASPKKASPRRKTKSPDEIIRAQQRFSHERVADMRKRFGRNKDKYFDKVRGLEAEMLERYNDARDRFGDEYPLTKRILEQWTELVHERTEQRVSGRGARGGRSVQIVTQTQVEPAVSTNEDATRNVYASYQADIDDETGGLAMFQQPELKSPPRPGSRARHPDGISRPPSDVRRPPANPVRPGSVSKIVYDSGSSDTASVVTLQSASSGDSASVSPAGGRQAPRSGAVAQKPARRKLKGNRQNNIGRGKSQILPAVSGPNFNLQKVSPGHYILRSTDVTPGVVAQLQSLLKKVPGVQFYVNGRIYGKRAGYKEVLRLLVHEGRVEVQF